MRLNGRIAALLVLLAVGAAACAGNPAPEPPPVVAETVPAPDADSLAAVRAAEREAAAARLCREAASAMAAGNYDRARSLYTQAQRDYAGTECANTAGGQIALIDAITVIRERVHFDFDKYNIRDDAAAVLQAKADVFRDFPGVKLTIEGHAIRGLYAAGRTCCGLPRSAENYSSGMSLADCTFFGRLAGTSAANAETSQAS